ncbi:MAG: hypothetical protein ACLP9L_16200 [Thermoguttaceae bacterium]
MARPPRLDFRDALYHVTSVVTGGSKSFGPMMIDSGSSANSPTKEKRQPRMELPLGSILLTATGSFQLAVNVWP